MPDSEPDKENVFGRLASAFAAFPPQGCLETLTSKSYCTDTRMPNVQRRTIPISAFQIREGLTCSPRSTIPDDLFGDDDDEADDNDFVPRGAHVRPTVMTPSTSSAGPIAVGKPTNGTSQAAARKDGATAKTGKQKVSTRPLDKNSDISIEVRRTQSRRRMRRPPSRGPCGD